MRVLLVEDDEYLANIIKKGLEEEAYHVDLCPDGAERKFMGMVEQGSYDGIVLDLGLPKSNGLNLLQRIRAQGMSTPVLILTAKDATRDKIEGLDTGADDYMIKPFDFEEFLARLRTILRRNPGVLKIHDLELDTARRKVHRGGVAQSLTGKEYLLLEHLIRNKNIVLSRTQIAEHIYGDSGHIHSNIIEVLINALRTKIDKDHPKKLIHTIRGIGYIFKE